MGADGGSEGLSYLGLQGGPATARPLCVCWVVKLSPLPAPHLSTKSRLSWREAARCPDGRRWTQGCCGLQTRSPTHSSQPLQLSLGGRGGWCKVGAPVSPLTSMTRSAPCPAGHHSGSDALRQMCQREGVGLYQVALPCQPWGPRYSRHLLPSPPRRRRLSSQLAEVQHTSLPTQGAWLSHDLALRGRACICTCAPALARVLASCVGTLACLCAPGAHTHTHVQEVRESVPSRESQAHVALLWHLG